mmetsp:Transcript_26485/g.89111  ORF Transcript_26485/g.89111 Transcript_26485/m.89111 type:complete len:588 (-) Transcript_26485:2356-4119(-)
MHPFRAPRPPTRSAWRRTNVRAHPAGPAPRVQRRSASRAAARASAWRRTLAAARPGGSTATAPLQSATRRAATAATARTPANALVLSSGPATTAAGRTARKSAPTAASAWPRTRASARRRGRASTARCPSALRDSSYRASPMRGRRIGPATLASGATRPTASTAVSPAARACRSRCRRAALFVGSRAARGGRCGATWWSCGPARFRTLASRGPTTRRRFRRGTRPCRLTTGGPWERSGAPTRGLLTAAAARRGPGTEKRTARWPLWSGSTSRRASTSAPTAARAPSQTSAPALLAGWASTVARQSATRARTTRNSRTLSRARNRPARLSRFGASWTLPWRRTGCSGPTQTRTFPWSTKRLKRLPPYRGPSPTTPASATPARRSRRAATAAASARGRGGKSPAPRLTTSISTRGTWTPQRSWTGSSTRTGLAWPGRRRTARRASWNCSTRFKARRPLTSIRTKATCATASGLRRERSGRPGRASWNSNASAAPALKRRTRKTSLCRNPARAGSATLGGTAKMWTRASSRRGPLSTKPVSPATSRLRGSSTSRSRTRTLPTAPGCGTTRAENRAGTGGSNAAANASTPS